MENNDQQQVNMDSSRFEIVPYDPMLSKAVARMWRDSKEQAQGFPERFDFDSQHAFVRDKLCCDCVITLVIDKTSEEVVAMLATGIGTIEQLYVHQDFQGLGIGTKLLSIAKSHSPRRPAALHTGVQQESTAILRKTRLSYSSKRICGARTGSRYPLLVDRRLEPIRDVRSCCFKRMRGATQCDLVETPRGYGKCHRIL